jgi:pimeloyl-ACP methyl ester carboxylesterase
VTKTLAPAYPRMALAALVAAFTLATAGCATGDGQAAASTLPNCSDVLLIGVRGTGESATQDHGLGPTIGGLYRLLSGNHPGLTTAVYGLPYASNTPDDSIVDDASARLADTAEHRHRQCPGERVVLAGYSLGAQITGDALQRTQLVGSRSYAAAVLFADPHFNPSDTQTAAGSYSPAYHGDRGPRPPYPAAQASLVRSFCRRHDPICQSGDPSADKSEHGRYTPTDVCQALTFIENTLRLPETDPQRCLTDQGAT